MADMALLEPIDPPRTALPNPTRDRAVDAARGLAVLSMLVAHFAVSQGPGHVLQLSEHLTAPLFAFLIGWGAMLGRDRPRALVSTLVRAAVLVGLGLGLERLDSQIIIVLVWLGALTLVCAVLVRLPDLVLVALGTATLLTLPSTYRWGVEQAAAARTADVLAGGDVHGVYPRLLEIALAGPVYRLTTFGVMACVAILLVRHDSLRVRAVSAALALVGTAGLLAAHAADVLTVEPYRPTVAAALLALGLAVLTVQGTRLLVGVAGWIAAPLAPLGAMALTAYTAQVVVAAWWVHDGRHPTDDSWLLLGAMALALLSAAWLWSGIGSGLAPGSAAARGPLEGLERGIVVLLARVLPHRARPRSGRRVASGA